MYAEIISIGSELTSGKNLDTNARWLSQRLSEVGIVTGWHTTIADDLQINIDAFRLASERAQLVLITGGLGPTQDDLTREVLAKVAGVELYHDPESEAFIRELFKHRNREMPERNKVQAMFPEGSTPIRNERGTAPGVWMKINDTWFAAMPGVPSEMYAMFKTQVLPRLHEMNLSQGVLIERKINCFGGGESNMEERVNDLTARGHVPEVGITASNATISMRIIAHGETLEDAQNQIAPVEATIRERLGNLVFGVDQEELQNAVLTLLDSHRQTLSVAEGLTGGWIAKCLTTIPGSSAWFKGGVVAYQNEAKEQFLKIPSTLIETHGAVSAEVAEAMAEQCRTLFNTDIAVSAVGFARPPAAEPEKPVGLVYVGLATKEGVLSRSYQWLAPPEEVQSRTAKMALNLVRLTLLNDQAVAIH